MQEGEWRLHMECFLTFGVSIDNYNPDSIDVLLQCTKCATFGGLVIIVLIIQMTIFTTLINLN